MHVLIVGTTMSGKTTVAKQLAKAARNSGRGVLVFDPIRDPTWDADYVCANMGEFLKIARVNKNCTLFIDEAATACGNYDKDSHWLATQARHWGHQSVFISQRPAQVAVNIRDNCSKLFCFQISFKDAQVYANEWCNDALLEAPTLAQGECLYLSRFGAPQKMNVFKNNA